jgi:hypothetical protein
VKVFLLDTNFIFSQTGGSVIKYGGNNARKQWLREPPDTLLNILKDADLSLAFQTYTIYRAGNFYRLHNHRAALIFKNYGKIYITSCLSYHC